MGATMHCSVRTYKVQFNSHASRGYICITGCGYSVRNYRISDSSASLKKLCPMHWLWVYIRCYAAAVSTSCIVDWLNTLLIIIRTRVTPARQQPWCMQHVRHQQARKRTSSVHSRQPSHRPRRTHTTSSRKLLKSSTTKIPYTGM